MTVRLANTMPGLPARAENGARAPPLTPDIMVGAGEELGPIIAGRSPEK